MTSLVDTSVKFFSSTQAGAPVLNGTAGALKALLDACLVDGFGLKSVVSLVVASGVATITVTGGHGFLPDGVMLVAGAATAALNGEQKVTAIGTNTASFATAVADQTATGSITVKNAPMGWGQAFAGTNTAAYKSLAPEATGCYLRLDDTGTNNARCVGYEFMGDIDSGQGSFPTIGQQPGGLYCPKSATADSTPRAWLLIGDARALYFCPATGGVPGNHEAYFFGDINSYKSGDAYSCVIGMPDTNAYTNSGSPAPGSIAISLRYSDDKPPYIARSHTGLGGAQGCARVGVLNISANQAYSGTNGYSGYTTDPFPNTANNGLIFCPVLCHTGGGFRGEFPGIVHVPQNCYGLFTTLDVVLGTGALAGKKALALRVGSAADGGAAAAAFFDATGPWRV